MSVQTVTDMRSFEGALGERWCHVTYADGRWLCGSGCGPSKGTAPHNSSPGPVCDGCGKRSCPDCQRIWREQRP